jgi:hypothetical protein
MEALKAITGLFPLPPKTPGRAYFDARWLSLLYRTVTAPIDVEATLKKSALPRHKDVPPTEHVQE